MLTGSDDPAFYSEDQGHEVSFGQRQRKEKL